MHVYATLFNLLHYIYRQSEDAKFKNTRMYFVRNEGDGETCMVEIPVT